MKKIHIRSAIAEGWSSFIQRPWYLLGIALAFALLFIVAVGDTMVTALASVLYGGYIMMLITHFRGGSIEFDDMFAINDRWISYSFLMIIKTFFIILGFLCFIIPGIYLSMRWAFAELLVIDQNMRPLEALRASSKMTEGNRWKLFWFTLVSMFLVTAGFFFFFIGAVVMGVVITLAMIKIYDDLKGTLVQTDVEVENTQEVVA